MNESFLLGLSSGASCLASCGMVLFPYVMSQQSTARYVSYSMASYLSARLLTYIAFGIAASLMGQAFFLFDVFWKTLITGGSYLFFSLVMAVRLLAKNSNCGNKIHLYHYKKKYKAEYIPLIYGFVSSINLCPPLLIAFTQTASQHLDPLRSVLNFVFFFLGTVVYFLPVPFLGFFKKNEILKNIGFLSIVLVTIWFFLKGLIHLISLML